jgi:hypothetical protein
MVCTFSVAPNPDYYRKQQTSYYGSKGGADGKEPRGHWYTPREQFGLVDRTTVDDDMYNALCDGRLPEGHTIGPVKKLRNETTGELESVRVGAYDMQFAAPKAFSVLWAKAAACDPELARQLEEAFEDSCRLALGLAQRNAAFTRTGGHFSEGKGDATTGQIVPTHLFGATYMHFSSRPMERVKADLGMPAANESTDFDASEGDDATEQQGRTVASDMNIHLHTVLLNLAELENTKVGNKQKWGALDARYGFHWKMAAGASQHGWLAHLLRERLGLHVKFVGNNAIWTLPGVEDDICTHFSRRRGSLEQQAAQFGIDPKDAPELAAQIIKMQRLGKDLEDDATHEDRVARWDLETDIVGFTEAAFRKVFEYAPTAEDIVAREAEFRDKLARLPDILTETESVVTKQHVYRTVITLYAEAGRTPDEAEAKIADLFAATALKTLPGAKDALGQDLFTTQAIQDMERQILDMAHAGRKTAAHILPAASVEAAIKTADPRGNVLSPEQAEGVRLTCRYPGQIAIVEGAAGTGKTFLLGTVAALYRDAGYRVIATSSAWATALDLARETSGTDTTADGSTWIKGQAAAKWIADWKRGEDLPDAKTLIMVDEAGQMGVRDTHALMTIAAQVGAKIVFTGDRAQQRSVGAGPALDIVASVVPGLRLVDTQRQKVQADDVLVTIDGLSRPDAIAAAAAMTDDQRADLVRMHGAEVIERVAELRHALNTTGRATVMASDVLTHAGGIERLARCYREAGHRVISTAATLEDATALAAKACATPTDEKPWIESAPPETWLSRWQGRNRTLHLIPNTLVLVDAAIDREAPATRSMLSAITEAGARYAFSDELICTATPVDRAAAVAIDATLSPAERQHLVDAHGNAAARSFEVWLRRAADHASRATPEDARAALDAFANHGRFRWCNTPQSAIAAAVDGWRRYVEEHPAALSFGHDSQYSAMLIGRSNADVRVMNGIVRAYLKEKQRIGLDDVTVQAITRSGAKLDLALATGDTIRFCRRDDTLQVYNGTIGRITSIAAHPDAANHRLLTVDIADPANPGTPRTRTVTVDTLAYARGRKTDTPPEKAHAPIEHSYASTTFSAQGTTRTATFVVVDGLHTANAFYVATSREKELISLYASRHKEVALLRDELTLADRLATDFTDDDLFRSLATRIARAQRKTCTLDYTEPGWREAALTRYATGYAPRGANIFLSPEREAEFAAGYDPATAFAQDPDGDDVPEADTEGLPPVAFNPTPSPLSVATTTDTSTAALPQWIAAPPANIMERDLFTWGAAHHLFGPLPGTETGDAPTDHAAVPPQPASAPSAVHLPSTSPAPPQPLRTQGIPPTADPPLCDFTDDHALKAHPDYHAAKAGDAEAATRLVIDLVTPATLREAARRFGPGTVFVPVWAEEATGRNAIPAALAEYLAVATGGTVDCRIVQANRPHHTGAGPFERLIARPIFDGPVSSGMNYVLVDDVSVLGGTLAELANHVLSQGGIVAGTALLANAGRSAVLCPTQHHIQIIERRFADDIRNLFGIDPAALTADEAKYLVNFRNADALRSSAAKATRERDARLIARGLRQPIGGDQATDGHPITAGIPVNISTPGIAPTAQHLSSISSSSPSPSPSSPTHGSTSPAGTTTPDPPTPSLIDDDPSRLLRFSLRSNLPRLDFGPLRMEMDEIQKQVAQTRPFTLPSSPRSAPARITAAVISEAASRATNGQHRGLRMPYGDRQGQQTENRRGPQYDSAQIAQEMAQIEREIDFPALLRAANWRPDNKTVRPSSWSIWRRGDKESDRISVKLGTNGWAWIYKTGEKGGGIVSAAYKDVIRIDDIHKDKYINVWLNLRQQLGSLPPLDAPGRTLSPEDLARRQAAAAEREAAAQQRNAEAEAAQRAAVAETHTRAQATWTRFTLPSSQRDGNYLQTRGIGRATQTAPGIIENLRFNTFGTANFAHRDAAGNITGYEGKGVAWNKFSTGPGGRTLALFGNQTNSSRILIAETGVDVLSRAQDEGLRSDTLYISSGGAPSTDGIALLKQIAAQHPSAAIDLGTDRDSGGLGQALIWRNALPDHPGGFTRTLPGPTRDFNNDLRLKLGILTVDDYRKDVAKSAPPLPPPPADRPDHMAVWLAHEHDPHPREPTTDYPASFGTTDTPTSIIIVERSAQAEKLAADYADSKAASDAPRPLIIAAGPDFTAAEATAVLAQAHPDIPIAIHAGIDRVGLAAIDTWTDRLPGRTVKHIPTPVTRTFGPHETAKSIVFVPNEAMAAIRCHLDGYPAATVYISTAGTERRADIEHLQAYCREHPDAPITLAGDFTAVGQRHIHLWTTALAGHPAGITAALPPHAATWTAGFLTIDNALPVDSFARDLTKAVSPVPPPPEDSPYLAAWLSHAAQTGWIQPTAAVAPVPAIPIDPFISTLPPALAAVRLARMAYSADMDEHSAVSEDVSNAERRAQRSARAAGHTDAEIGAAALGMDATAYDTRAGLPTVNSRPGLILNPQVITSLIAVQLARAQRLRTESGTNLPEDPAEARAALSAAAQKEFAVQMAARASGHSDAEIGAAATSVTPVERSPHFPGLVLPSSPTNAVGSQPAAARTEGPSPGTPPTTPAALPTVPADLPHPEATLHPADPTVDPDPYRDLAAEAARLAARPAPTPTQPAAETDSVADDEEAMDTEGLPPIEAAEPAPDATTIAGLQQQAASDDLPDPRLDADLARTLEAERRLSADAMVYAPGGDHDALMPPPLRSSAPSTAAPSPIGEEFGVSSDKDAQRHQWLKELGQWYQYNFSPKHENEVQDVVFNAADDEVTVHFKDGSQITDNGRSILLSPDGKSTEGKVQLLVEIALARGLTEVSLRGSRDFKLALARECYKQGLTVRNPTRAMRDEFKAMADRGIMPATRDAVAAQRHPAAPAPMPGTTDPAPVPPVPVVAIPAEPAPAPQPEQIPAPPADILGQRLLSATAARMAMTATALATIQATGDLSALPQAQADHDNAAQAHAAAQQIIAARTGLPTDLSPNLITDDMVMLEATYAEGLLTPMEATAPNDQPIAAPLSESTIATSPPDIIVESPEPASPLPDRLGERLLRATAARLEITADALASASPDTAEAIHAAWSVAADAHEAALQLVHDRAVTRSASNSPAEPDRTTDTMTALSADYAEAFLQQTEAAFGTAVPPGEEESADATISESLDTRLLTLAQRRVATARAIYGYAAAFLDPDAENHAAADLRTAIDNETLATEAIAARSNDPSSTQTGPYSDQDIEAWIVDEEALVVASLVSPGILPGQQAAIPNIPSTSAPPETTDRSAATDQPAAQPPDLSADGTATPTPDHQPDLAFSTVHTDPLDHQAADPRDAPPAGSPIYDATVTEQLVEAAAARLAAARNFRDAANTPEMTGDADAALIVALDSLRNAESLAAVRRNPTSASLSPLMSDAEATALVLAARSATDVIAEKTASITPSFMEGPDHVALELQPPEPSSPGHFATETEARSVTSAIVETDTRNPTAILARQRITLPPPVPAITGLPELSDSSARTYLSALVVAATTTAPIDRFAALVSAANVAEAVTSASSRADGLLFEARDIAESSLKKANDINLYFPSVAAKMAVSTAESRLNTVNARFSKPEAQPLLDAKAATEAALNHGLTFLARPETLTLAAQEIAADPALQQELMSTRPDLAPALEAALTEAAQPELEATDDFGMTDD